MFDIQSSRLTGTALDARDPFSDRPWNDTRSGNADCSKHADGLVHHMGNEVARTHGPSFRGRSDETHLRYGLLRHIPEIHQPSRGEPDPFHAGLERRVLLQIRG